MASISVQSGKKNSFSKILKLAYMNYDPEKPYFYFTIKAKNSAEKLKKIIDKFISQMMLFFELLSSGDSDADKILDSLRFRVSQINSKVVIIFDFGESEITADFKKEFDSIFRILQHIKPNLLLKFRSCVDFSDILPKPENYNIDENGSNFDNPNLLDFILKGFLVNLTLSCSSHVKDTLANVIQNLAKTLQEDNGTFRNIIYNMGGEENFIKMVKKMIPETEEEVYKNFDLDNLKEKLSKAIEGEKVRIPDGIDIVDEIGHLLSIYYNEAEKDIPFMEEFIHDMKEFATCNIEVGIVHRSINISASFKSSGIKELTEMALGNFEEPEAQGEDF